MKYYYVRFTPFGRRRFPISRYRALFVFARFSKLGSEYIDRCLDGIDGSHAYYLCKNDKNEYDFPSYNLFRVFSSEFPWDALEVTKHD